MRLVLLISFVAAIFAYAAPHLAARAGQLVRAITDLLTRRAWVGAVFVAALPITIRLALVPWWPVPQPRIQDEFCYIYAADTFSLGRVVNPAQPLWQFFEAPQLVVQPAMFSKYPPAQGMMLAVGQVLFGHPWYGVVLSSGLLCAACYWMLLAAGPRRWALWGALVPAGHLALSTYWMNSYWGGNVAAAAGALMIGAVLRLRRRPEARWAMVFVGAWTVLAASRPYEGAVLLGAPLAIALIIKVRMHRNVWLAGAAVGAFGGVLLAGYNIALTGSPVKLPYAVYYEQYSYVPNFAFLSMGPKPAYRQDLIESAMVYDERVYRTLHGPGRLARLGGEWMKTWPILSPLLLLAALALLAGRLVGWCRTRWFVALLGFGFVCMNFGTFQFTHYFAPFVPLLFLLTAFALRTLMRGRWAQVALFALVVGSVAESARAVYSEIRYPEAPLLSSLRPAVVKALEETIEDHLIFVRDIQPVGASSLRPSWLYNPADLISARVIWAADRGAAENQNLISMYPERRVWRLAIEQPLILRPYGSASPLQQPMQFRSSAK